MVTLYHKNGTQCLYKEENTIPPSLKEAINVFNQYSNKIFRKKVHNHNSMLIHVSRFKNVQGNVFNQVRKYLDDLKKIIQCSQDENTKQEIKNSLT